MSNSKTSNKRRAWTEKRRENQAQNCRKTKPWAHTTGPKTAKGKATCADNAYKHGLRSKEMEEIERLLSKHKEFLENIKFPSPLGEG